MKAVAKSSTPQIFKRRRLCLRHGGNAFSGWAAMAGIRDIVSGEETFIVVARSKAGLKRVLHTMDATLKPSAKTFAKVEVTL
jgi:hypothetical protein